MTQKTLTTAPVCGPNKRLLYLSPVMKAKDLLEAVKDFKFQHYKVNASN